MPFTFSHPAAVVPLRRTQLIFSALVIGSMAPDVESFLHLTTHVNFSHTFPGVFLFCLPAGLCLYFLFHRVLKHPLLMLLPGRHQARLFPLVHSHTQQRFNASCLFNVFLSLLLGTFTHVVWDAFTHEYGWFVLRIPALQMTALHTAHRDVRVYTILQHGSSVVGLVLLFFWYIRWFRNATPQPVPASLTMPVIAKIGIGLCISFGAMLAAAGYAWIRALAASDGRVWYWAVRGFILAGMLTAFLEFVLMGLGWHMRKQFTCHWPSTPA